MTLAELKKILETVPDDAIVLLEDADINDLETTSIEYHADGRVHVILSTLE